MLPEGLLPSGVGVSLHVLPAVVRLGLGHSGPGWLPSLVGGEGGNADTLCCAIP